MNGRETGLTSKCDQAVYRDFVLKPLIKINHAMHVKIFLILV